MFTASMVRHFSLGSRIRHYLSVPLLALTVCFGYFLIPQQAYAADNTAFCATVSDVTADQCLALMSIYDNTGGPNWTNNSGWGTSTTVHQWFGIGVFEVCTGEERACQQIGVPVYENICTPVYENICTPVCDENGENCYDDCQDVYQYDDCQDVYQYDDCQDVYQYDEYHEECTGNGIVCTNEIKTLELSNNNLLGDLVISQGNLGSVAFLNLYNNQISSFDSTGMSGIIGLYIFNNQISSFDGTGMNGLQDLNISSNQLTSFDGTGLSGLQSLNLSDNKFTSFDGTGLSGLQSLNLSNNQLTSFDDTGLSGLQSLNLSNNQLTSFDGTGLNGLQSLNLSDNQFTSFDGTGLNGLTGLYLSNNQLTSFDGTNMNSLHVLNLGSNKFKSFDSTGLSGLTGLYLSNNQLTSFDGTNMNSLHDLDLGSNKFKSFDGTGLSGLIGLYLNGNLLKSFNSTGLSGLEWLYLNGNQLTSFDGTHLGSLHTIHLQNNQFTSFDATGMSALKYLELNDNLLTSFDTTDMKGLKQIRLSNNLLTSFDGTGMNSLEQFVVNDNKITTLINISDIPVDNQSVTIDNNCLNRAALDISTTEWLDRVSNDWTNQSSECNAVMVIPSVSNITNTTSTITWETDIATTSQVQFRLPGDNYWYWNTRWISTPITDLSPQVNNHSVTLTDLNPCTLYTYRIFSGDTDTNTTVARSLDNIFNTTGCIASSPVLDTSTEQITTADGGSLVLKDENLTGMTLTVPSAFSVSDANFQAKQLDKTTVMESIGSPTDRSLVKNLLYELKAATDISTTLSTFETPLTMSMTYGPDDIVGIDELSLHIFSWNGTTWNMLPNCAVNTTTRTVTCTTTHFSVFGLFGEAIASIPTITTPISSSITSTTAILGSDITSLGIPDTITARGICWGMSASPVTNCNVEGGTTIGTFTQAITGLAPSTTYYFRGYATNATGTAYSEDDIFTTLDDTVVTLPHNESLGGGSGGRTILLHSAPKETPATPQTSLDSFLQKRMIEKNAKLATRLETVMFALKTGGISMEKEYTCLNLFADTAGKSVPFYTCQVAEKAREKKIISQTDKQFNPMKPVSRVEAYAIMMKSVCILPETTPTNWQTEVIKKSMELGFTIRTLDTFEPNKTLTKQEMYILVQKINDYRKVHGACSSIR